MRELAEFLIEIHGQQEFQRLVNRAAQREVLDEQLPDVRLLDAGCRAFRALPGLPPRFRVAQDSGRKSRLARSTCCAISCTELKAEVTTVTEIEELFADQKRIAGRGRLAAAARAALIAAYEAEGESAHDLLGRAGAALRSVGGHRSRARGARQAVAARP